MPDQTITSVSREHRKFRPSAEFKAQANLGSDAAYKRLYSESVNSPEKFWDKQAKEHLIWRKPYKKVLEWKAHREGVSIETVSVLLGHSNTAITLKHYRPWVKSLQEKLEQDVALAWQ